MVSFNKTGHSSLSEVLLLRVNLKNNIIHNQYMMKVFFVSVNHKGNRTSLAIGISLSEQSPFSVFKPLNNFLLYKMEMLNYLIYLLILTMHYIKDRTENFDDYFPCKNNKCKLNHIKQWLKLFVYQHNKEIIS